MAARLGVTGSRLLLGVQLRQLRENFPRDDGSAPGLTRKQAVQGSKISEASLQRIETGSLNFRNVGDLRKLLGRYGIDDEDFIESLVELNNASSRQDWITQHRHHMPPGMPGFVGLESEARQVRAYHPTIIYGLLQTENYAKALFELGKPVEETTSEGIKHNLAVRMKRKSVLVREPEPVKLWVILTETALRYTVGGTSVIREQYEEIARLSKLEHVQIQVLPLSSKGYRSISDFTTMDLGSDLPMVVQVDTAWGAVSTSDKPREVDRFNRRFSTMTASALPPEDTPEFLHRLAKEL